MLFNKQMDEDKTADNVKIMLNDYHYYHQLAKKVMLPTFLQSPSMNGMPKASSTENSQENKIINAMSKQDLARYYCIVVDRTIEAIEDETKRTILNECYIKHQYDNSYVMYEIGIAETRYYELKREAILTFADICPGNPSIDDDGNWVYEDIKVYK